MRSQCSFPDSVDHPAHYAAHYRHEVIELTSRFDFSSGNALKYVLRHQFKGRPAEDLEKARWYVCYLLTFPSTGRLISDSTARLADRFAADLRCFYLDLDSSDVVLEIAAAMRTEEIKERLAHLRVALDAIDRRIEEMESGDT